MALSHFLRAAGVCGPYKLIIVLRNTQGQKNAAGPLTKKRGDAILNLYKLFRCFPQRRAVTPARVMAQPVIASIEVPANTVSGYSLMQINADGTETPVSVSYNTELNKAYFRLDVTTGAQLLRMVPTT